MKRLVLLALLFLIHYHQIMSQTWRRVGHWGNQFTDIHWTNSEIGYISGENIILKTIDGGLSWVEQEAPIPNVMQALDFFDQNNGIIVGNNGAVFRTSNGGLSWEIVEIATSSNLKRVSYLSRSKVIVIGEQETYLQSLDGGTSWTKRNIGTGLGDLNALFFVNGDSGFIASSNSEIIRTVNGGASWEVIQTDFESPLNDLFFINDTLGYAVGDLGTIIKTENAGSTWTFINSGMDLNFNKVYFSTLNPQLGAIVGNNGTVLRTANGGLSFVAVGSRTTHDIKGIGFKPNTNLAFAVASSGVVISSTNAGGSWTLRQSGRNNDFTGVQFLTDLRGYVIGQNGLILLTANGGNTFTDRTRPLSLPFNALYFVTGTQGYVSGNNGNIISTTNSGAGWTALNPGTNRNINGMHFFDINLGYVVGSRGFISKTDNRGITWTNIAAGNGSLDYKDIRFFNTDTGIIVGDGGWISRSEGGMVWDKINVATNQNFNSLAILDENTAIIVGDKGIILKTVDQGKSWKEIKSGFSQRLSGIAFLDESVGFVTGEKGLMLKSTNGGESWEKVLTGTFQNFTGISFGDLNTGYAVGENGTFFSYTCLVPEQPTTIFGEKNICKSQQIYSVQASSEQGVSYEWRIDGGKVLEGQGSHRIVVEWETTGRNAIMVRGQNNCGNSSISAIEVLVSGSPNELNAIQGEGIACLNTIGEFFVDSIPGTEYFWQATGGLIRSGQGTSKINVEWTGLGQHLLKVAAQNPCGTGPLSEKNINVITTPARPSNIIGTEMVGLEEVAYEISAQPGINYQWSAEGGGRILSGQGSGNVIVKWEKEGDFILKVTPMNACNFGQSREITVKVNLITNIEENSRSNHLIIYPVPSKGNIHIQATGIPEIIEISIFNAFGQNIFLLTPNSGIFEWEIGNLPKGVHSLILRSKNKQYVKKIIIQ